MNSFFHAIGFLSRIPVPVRENRDDWEKSPMWYPLVGLILGALITLFDMLIAGWFPAFVRAVMDAAFWFFLTGGLHLDGLMDTADGLGAWRDRERTLQIMKDSRVGAMGVLAGVLSILFKVSLLASLPAANPLAVSVIAATVLGRTAVLGMMYAFPYIQEHGTGTGMKEKLTVRRFLFALLCMVIIVIFLTRWWAGVLLGAAAFVVLCFGWQVTKRLGGCTGDVYGAVIEGIEILTLCILVVPGVSVHAIDLAPPW
ncbi:adenosylcobinamide-GDP ribazoletransferase [Paenactinomyces guangxiensis]|uniref:Adenosylcobinamide-GDP ribazoletransferase n=1 Tax=Paenactinomyces guangxiensis TaxID=1490290 RepID=A0A7W1WMV0_9BACL|nr:adenosylcobinamide-GDP ribazoletransferase [Paenactinomyces guangxiensis]MBA4492802.1 adenosylcobinamide-GDP ribazoletransferase [Paenactinomyces guangxiensis]MBH8590349.1 adenosylcobinamide-GDP ribazoletransferase [Paenactinomyces guangxiensis]